MLLCVIITFLNSVPSSGVYLPGGIFSLIHASSSSHLARSALISWTPKFVFRFALSNKPNRCILAMGGRSSEVLSFSKKSSSS